jgi:hypothetical protein
MSRAVHITAQYRTAKGIDTPILSYPILSVYSALLEVQYVLWEYSAV